MFLLGATCAGVSSLWFSLRLVRGAVNSRPCDRLVLRLYLIFFHESAGGEDAVRRVLTASATLQAQVAEIYEPVPPTNLLLHPGDPDFESCLSELNSKALHAQHLVHSLLAYQ